MNARDPNDPVSRSLAAWRLAPAADPNFRPHVWQRINDRARSTWSGYVHAHLTRWSVVAALTLLVAGWTGHQAAEARMNAQRDAMITAYLVELDPRVQALLRPIEP